MPTTLSVTRTTLGFAPGGDLDGDGQYDPGDIITIRIRVTNSTGPGQVDALNVSVTDTVSDPGSGITLVPGSIEVSPIPFNDAYALSGNTPITISAAAGVLINDTDPGPGGNTATLIVTEVNGFDISGGPIDVGNGIVSMNADGGFTFTPDTGFEGDVTFTYTAEDGQGLSSPVGGTVTMTVGGALGMIWYVDNGAATNGDGSYLNPFQSFTELAAGGADPDDSGDTIFVYESGSAYASGITLEDGQTLRSEGGASFVVNGITLGGGATDVTINHAGAGITLGQNNTVQGFDIVGTAVGAVGIQDGGGSVGTLTITDTDVSGTGKAVDIDQGGVLAVTLGTLSSVNSTTEGVQLSGDLTTAISGSFSAGSGAITGATSYGFLMGDGLTDHAGTVAVTYGGDISSSTGGGVRIVGRDASAGTINFTGNITQSGAGTGILVQTIDSGTINFTGNKSIASTGAFDGVSLTGLAGGTVNLTTGTFTIDTVDGHGINMGAITGGSVNLSASGTLDIDVTGVGRGVSILGAGAASSGAAGTVTFSGDLDITTADGVGLRADITGGTFLNLSSAETGTKSITTGVGGTAAGVGTGGALVVLNNVQIGTLFDIDTLNATESANGIGVNLTNVDNGSFHGGALTIAGSTGDGVNISGGTSSNVAFTSATIGTGTTVVSGDGIELNATTGTVTFGTVDIDNVGGIGVRIDSAANTVAINGGSIGAGTAPSITGDGVNITGGTGNITVAASVTKTTAGNVVEVNDHDFGTVTFSGNLSATGTANNGILVTGNDGTDINFTGQTINLSTGANTAVSITSNISSTIDFAPTAGGTGLDITTTTGTGFAASGGGTVTVTQTAQGANGNSITTGAGTALSISGTNIGTADVTFTSISANGGTNGIVLANTGTTASFGGLVVTGDTGTAGRQGGTIQNTTGDAISLTNTRDVSFNEVTIANGGLHGVNGTGVTNFTFSNGFVDDPGDADNEHGIFFGQVGATNITGTLNLTGTTIEDFQDNGLYVTNTSGTLVINVTDVVFQNNSATNGEEGIYVDASGTANTTLNVTGTPTNVPTNGAFTSTTRFTNLEGGAINGTVQGSGVLDINITSILSTGTGGVDNFPTPPSLTFTSDGAASTMTFDIINSRLDDNSGDGIFIGGEGALMGRITGNAIVNMLTGDGIRIDTDAVANATSTILIQNNLINSAGDDGIQVLHRDGAKTLNLTIDGNTITNTASEGVRIFVDDDDAGAGSPTARFQITNNVFGNNGTVDLGDSIVIIAQDNSNVANEINANSSVEGITLTQTLGAILSIEQASTAALGTANGGATVTPTGTITFNTAVSVPQPTNPLFADPNPPAPPPADEDPADPPAGGGGDTPPADDPSDPPADEDPADPPADDPADPPAPPAHPVIVDDNILTQAELDYLKDAAISRWAAAGASEAQLAEMRATAVSVADMMGLYLGKSAPGSVLIDSDAAGYGWFLDHTPDENGEFVAVGERLYAKAGTDAVGHMDLLTVLMHELGHQIGLDDSYKSADVDELMYGYAAVGQRKQPEADDLDDVDPDHVPHEAYALPAVSIGTLPVGQTVDVEFQATIDAQTNQAIVNPNNTATVTLSNGNAASYTANEVLDLDDLTLGGTVWLDMGAGGGGVANDGIINGTEAGIDGVSVSLFADTGTSAGVWDAGDTQIGTSQLTAGGGNYSFTGLAPGDYVVRIDLDNFDAGGNTSLTGSPISSAPNATDPDNNVDNDDNGVQAAAGQATYSLAITLDYNTEPTAGMGNDTNNTVDFGFVSNIPPSIVLTSALATYNEPVGPNSSGGGVIVLNDAAITDPDDANIESATVTVNDFVAGDVLGFAVGYTLPGGIVANYNSGTGVLTLTGTATKADYELAFENVRYSHTGDNPSVFGTDNTRQLGFVVNDGIASSTVANTTVAIAATDDTPVNAVPASFSTSEDAAIFLTGLLPDDPDNNSGLYTVVLSVRHGTLDVRTNVAGGINAADIVAGDNGTNGITIVAPIDEIRATFSVADALTYTPDSNFNVLDSITVSTFDGVPTDVAQFAGWETAATSSDPLASIVSADLDGDGDLDLVYATNQVASGTVYVQLNEGGGVFSAGGSALPTGRVTTEVIVGQFNPTVDNIPDIAVANYWNANPNTQGGLSIFFGTGGGNFGAVQHINDGTSFASYDLISGDFDNDGDTDIVMDRRDTSQGTLYRSNGDGTFTNSSFALSVGADFKYTSGITAGDFNNDGRLDIISVNPGDRASGLGPGTISLILGGPGGSFQAPTNLLTGLAGLGAVAGAAGDFNNDGNLDFAYIQSGLNVLLGNGDGTFAAPVNYVLISPATAVEARDVNGDGILDLVATASDASGEVTVLNGAGNGTFLGEIRHNVADNPESLTIGDFNGDGANDVATASGGPNEISVLLSITPNRGDVDTVPINITAVNDAPVVINGTTQALTAINEDTPSAAGQTVNSLLASHYSDAADDQFVFGGSSPGAFSGVAVISSGSSASGEWQYSTNGGGSWNNIGAASLGAAKLFSNTVAFRFSPATDFNGAAPALDVRLIDNSLGFGIDNTPQVVDISAVGATGGTTAYSAATVSLTQAVTAVNDAPVLDASKSPTLTTINEDPGTPVGAVGDLVSNLVDLTPPSGQLDNVTDVDNVVTGVAVTGVNSGTLWYSLDGGTNWTQASGLSAASALLLPADANARIYFQPNANLNGAVGNAIIFKAWDQTAGSAGGTADTTTGSTAFSSVSDSASITINAINDSPVVPNSPTVTVNEQTAGFVNSAITISDVDLDARNGGAGDYGGATFIINRDVSNAEDLFGFSTAGAAFTVNGANLESGGQVFATFSQAGGILNISFTSSGTAATTALVNDVLRHITYTNSSDTPPASVNLIYLLDDGAPDAVQGALGSPFNNLDGGSVTINITAVNDAPQNTVPGAQSVNEDASLTLSTGNGNALSIADVDAGGSSVSVTLSVLHGSLTLASTAGLTFTNAQGDALMTFTGTITDINAALGSGVIYAPAANYNGGETLTIVTDDQGATGTPGAQSDTDTVAITVNSVSDEPAGADNTVTGSEDDPYIFLTSEFTVSDPNDTPPDTLAGIIVESLPTEGVLENNGLPVAVNDFISFADIAAGNFRFIPDPDEFSDPLGSVYASFQFRVRDTGSLANGGVNEDQSNNVMNIIIEPDNLPPVANDDAFSLNEDSTLNGVPPGVLANDLDDGRPDPLSVSAILVSGPLHAASFTFNADGTFTYTPVANYNGTDSFTYKLNDTQYDSNVATVTLTINPVNDAPVTNAESYSIAEDTLLSVAAPGVVGNDTDIDSPTITAVLVSGPAHAATFVLNADGSFNYQATANYNGADSFTYRSFDGSALGNIVTVNLTVTPVDDVSVTGPDSFTIAENVVLNANLLGNDSDIDGPALAVTEVNGSAVNVGAVITLASGAKLQVNANGDVVYNTNNAFNTLTIAATGASNLQALDSFTYRTDSGNTATVTITVNGLRTTTDLLIGTAGNNVITDAGFNFSDSFRLEQGGNDTATGLGGNDGFYFGAAYTSLDSVDGGTGADSVALQGNYAAPTVLGTMVGVENLVLLAGNNTAFGDLAGNFYDYNIVTNNGNVAAGGILTVIGGNLRAGEDLVFNGAAETDGAFRIFAGQGNDVLTGGAGNDGFFFGADGNLTGADIVNGGGGIDSIAIRGNYSGGSAIVFTATSMVGVETLVFLSGTTNEFGGFIVPGGFDYSATMADANVAAGQLMTVAAANLAASESLFFDGRLETDGAYRILSGAGDDFLYGGSGNDSIYGGLGADRLEGSAGADTYVYRFATESTAASRDFVIWGAGDKMDLSLIDANSGTAANDAFSFIGSGLFTGVAGQLRVTAQGLNGLVEGDVNGDGIADFSVLVQNYVPVAGDFVL